MSTARDYILHKIRTALGRSAGQPASPLPAPSLRVPEVSEERRIAMFRGCIEALAGKTLEASDPSEARAYAAELLTGRTAVASNAPFLRSCGILDIPGVVSDF